MRKSWNFVVALALIPLSFALHLCAVAGDTGDVICAQRPEESKSLRLVIGDKSRNEFLFGEYRFNRMPLTLIAVRDGVILYESSLIASNALSFAAVDRNQRSKSYRIQRSPPDFAKFPNQHYRLNDGDFLIRDINLCDGYWRIVEKLAQCSSGWHAKRPDGLVALRCIERLDAGQFKIDRHLV